MPEIRPLYILKQIAIATINLLLYGVLAAGAVAYLFAPADTFLMVLIGIIAFSVIAQFVFPPFAKSLAKRSHSGFSQPPPGQQEFAAAFPRKKANDKEKYLAAFLRGEKSVLIIISSDANISSLRIDQLTLRKLDHSRVAILGWPSISDLNRYLILNPWERRETKIVEFDVDALRNFKERLGETGEWVSLEIM